MYGTGNSLVLSLKVLLFCGLLKIITDHFCLSAALQDIQSIKKQVKQLQDHFIRLAYCTYEELVENGISVHEGSCLVDIPGCFSAT